MDDLADDYEGLSVRHQARAGNSRGGRRGGKARGSSSGGSGGGGGKGRETSISRALSRLLRHQAEAEGIKLDVEGFAPLDRVLQWGPLRSLAPTLAELKDLVRDNDKQRFALKPNPATNPDLDEASTDPGQWLIRANQGHSIKLDSSGLLRPIALPLADGSLPEGAAPVPPTVVHGTYVAFWPAIVASGGLRRMGRNHVHCGTGVVGEGAGEDDKVVSGMRRDAELLVYVDVERSMREGGLGWWLSENGVVLTEGDADGLVPARFFRLVEGRRMGVGVLWRDGEKVADLPEGVKGRVPRGKERAGGQGGLERGKGRGRGGGGRGG